MFLVLKKQHVNFVPEVYPAPLSSDGHDWVEAYDVLQRNWPYSRTARAPYLIEAAARVVSRRRHRPIPPRQAFKSTIDYYEALIPLLLAQSRLEHTTSWRYVRPLMIRLMLRSWPMQPDSGRN